MLLGIRKRLARVFQFSGHIGSRRACIDAAAAFRTMLIVALTTLSQHAAAKQIMVLAAPYLLPACSTGVASWASQDAGDFLAVCMAYQQGLASAGHGEYEKIWYENGPRAYGVGINGGPVSYVADLHGIRRSDKQVVILPDVGIAAVNHECPNDNKFSGPHGGTTIGMSEYYVCGYTTPDPDPPAQDCKTCGNPVAYETGGTKTQKEVDYVSPTDLNFTRHYRSDTDEYAHLYEHYAHDAPTGGGGKPQCYPGEGKVSGFQQCFAFTTVGTGKLEISRPGILRELAFDPATLLRSSPDLIDRVTAMPGGGWRVLNGSDNRVETYDARGQIVSRRTASGRGQTIATAMTPDDYGHHPKIPGNITQTVADDFGHTLTVVHDLNGRLLQMTDPAGGVYTYSYDALGNQTQVTYPGGTFKQYHFEDATHPRKLTGITDENGVRFATFAYDGAGHAVSTEHAGGVEKYQFDYQLTGWVPAVVITDPLGTVRTMGMTSLLGTRKQTKVTQPCSTPNCTTPVSSTLTLDPNNSNVLSRTDFNGVRTDYTYDVRNLELTRIEGNKVGSTTPTRMTTTAWHADWRLPVSIREPRKVTTFAYQGDPTVSCAPQGASTALVCSKTVQANDDPDGKKTAPGNEGDPRTRRYTYNILGQVLSVDGPLPNTPTFEDVTRYEYYPNVPSEGLNRGMLKKITNALGHVMTLGDYDAHGNPQTIVDANNLVTTLTYDVRQRLKTRTAGGKLTKYDYDNAGQLKIVTLPDNSTVQYFYDDAHRLIQIQDTLGNKVRYVLDNMGNRLSELYFDASNDYPAGGVGLGTPGHETSREVGKQFDTLNRLLKAFGGATQGTLMEYDDNGNLKTVKEALTRVTTNFYDALNRLTEVEDPVNGSTHRTKYEFDGQDNLTKVTDAKGLSTVYTYNGHGDLLSQTSPDTGTTTFAYDLAGNVIEKSDSRGITVYYKYDALNRLILMEHKATSATVPNPNPVLESATYTYDSCANGKGRLCQFTDKSGTTSWTYEQDGLVASKTQSPIGGTAQTANFTYNAAGQLVRIVTPAGTVIDFTYLNGRPMTVTVNERLILNDAVYEPFGPLGGFKWGNHTATAPNFHVRLFDKDYRAIEVTTDQPTSGAAPVIKRTLMWDDFSRITDINDPASLASSFKYGYDNLDRLTSVTPKTTGATEKFGYTYDAIGNRLTSKVDNAATTIYTYPATSHRLQSLTGAQAKSYTYDNAGNMTSDGTQIWTYGPDNRPTQVTVGGITTNLSINALGQRVKKATGTTGTQYFYDDQGRLLGEYNLDGTLIQENVWFNDLPVAIVKPNTLGDFGGDGKADILWRHTSGYLYLQPMNGFTPTGGAFIDYYEPDPNWRVVAQGDVDGDRRQDIVWWHQASGHVYVQLMDGNAVKAGNYVSQKADTAWRIVAAKDLDGDGKADLVWWNNTTGAVYVEYLDGFTVKGSTTPAAQASAAWKLVGTGDATGDGKADLLWRNDTTGEVKLQSDLTTSGTTIYTEPNLAWTILGMPDLNGDGKADILWKNTSTGSVFGQLLNGTTITTSGVIYNEPNLAWKLVHMADFNGDGKTDLLWRNSTTGDVFEQQMNGLSVATSQVIYSEPDQGWKIVPMQDQTGSGALATMAATSSSKVGQKNQRPNPPGFGSIGQALNAMNINTTAIYYVHSDHLGTPRVITRPSDNKVVWRWDNVEPFGNNLPDENPSGLGVFKNNLRHLGQIYDEETGTFYNWNRDYDPARGRYLQADPLGALIANQYFGRKAGKFDPSLNHSYAYVDSSPLNFVDPKGLSKTMTMSRILGGAVTGGARGSLGGIAGLLGGMALGAGISMCEVTPRDRCERRCDEDLKRAQTFCHLMAIGKGRYKGSKIYDETYSRCMQVHEEVYYECYQECGGDDYK